MIFKNFYFIMLDNQEKGSGGGKYSSVNRKGGG